MFISNKMAPKSFNRNQLKKILYKEKPVAYLREFVEDENNGYYTYLAETTVGLVEFNIPKEDAPENLDGHEKAQLLIRWLVVESEKKKE